VTLGYCGAGGGTAFLSVEGQKQVDVIVTEGVLLLIHRMMCSTASYRSRSHCLPLHASRWRDNHRRTIR